LKVKATDSTYDGDKAIIETGAINAYNIYGAGIDEIVARLESGTTAYYFAQDHEGSVTHVFDASGNLVESYRYDAFGAPTIFDQSAIGHTVGSWAHGGVSL
jgi:uncharacterized protein RhaS with RHS repeats